MQKKINKKGYKQQQEVEATAAAAAPSGTMAEKQWRMTVGAWGAAVRREIVRDVQWVHAAVGSSSAAGSGSGGGQWVRQRVDAKLDL